MDNIKSNMLDLMFPRDDRASFERFPEAPATDTDTDDLTLAAMFHHYRNARDRAEAGNVHLFHYADLIRDPIGQIARATRFDAMRATVASGDQRSAIPTGVTRSHRSTAMRNSSPPAPPTNRLDGSPKAIWSLMQSHAGAFANRGYRMA